MKLFKWAVLTIAIVFHFPAHAADEKFYAGANGGEMRKAYIGGFFKEKLGAEFGLASIGEERPVYNQQGHVFSIDEAHASLRIYYLALVSRVPLGERITFNARAGVHVYAWEICGYRYIGCRDAQDNIAANSGIDFLYGVGITIGLGKRNRARLIIDYEGWRFDTPVRAESGGTRWSNHTENALSACLAWTW